VTAIQQQRRDGGTDVAIVIGDNCVDFFLQRFFCQFLGDLRTHGLDLLSELSECKVSDWQRFCRCSYYVPWGARVKGGK
jgi:hypothetical protein